MAYRCPGTGRGNWEQRWNTMTSLSEETGTFHDVFAKQHILNVRPQAHAHAYTHSPSVLNGELNAFDVILGKKAMSEM